MILLTALLAGLLAGLILARRQKRAWALPPLRCPWLAVIAFLPQFFAFYLPVTRTLLPDFLASASLLLSQALLLIFGWLNHRLAGMWALALGLALNLMVIAANGGFMPISPETASRLVPASVVQSIEAGSRFGEGKDILLLPEDTHLPCLSDRFLPPEGFPYQVAFSAGDILIAGGIFWLMARNGIPMNLWKWNKERGFLICYQHNSY